MDNTPGGEVLVYEAPDGGVRVDVRLDHETVWLTQRQMAELFDSSTDNIGLHLKNIVQDNELDEAATTEDFSVVQSERGRRVRRRVKHYNLDAIISVGYRVNSRRGVRFRQWATATLREHLVRGYTLHHQRFEDNARELESALALVRNAASGETLTSDQGRGLRMSSPATRRRSSCCSGMTRDGSGSPQAHAEADRRASPRREAPLVN